MQRRDLLKGATLGSLAGILVGPAVAGVAGDKPSSEAAAALQQLQQALDELEVAFSSPGWKLRTPQDFAEARRVMLHVLMHGLECWMEADPGGEQSYLVGSQKRYGEPLMAYLDLRGIGWVACWYDDEWKPAMFEGGIGQSTPFAIFVLQRLSGQ